MKAVHPYLNFDGITLEAFEFYRSVFGGEFTNVTRYREMGGVEMGIAEDKLDLIANIGLPLADNVVLMGTDVVPGFGQEHRPGNNVSITLEPDSPEEAERLFSAMSAGGEVEMGLDKTEWAEAFGSFRDRFGVQWMVNYTGSVEFSPAPVEEAR